MKFEFRELQLSDKRLLRIWLKKPHLELWSSSDKVLNEYALKAESGIVTPYMVQLNGEPIGYIHYETIDIETAKLQFFIGKTELLGKGIGPKFLSDFIEKIVGKLNIKYLITEPAKNNSRAMKALEKVQFKRGAIEESSFVRLERQLT
jgi:RimJ/RimL family protein N-acetyltransferase